MRAGENRNPTSYAIASLNRGKLVYLEIIGTTDEAKSSS